MSTFADEAAIDRRDQLIAFLRLEAEAARVEAEQLRRIAQAARDFNTLPTAVTAMALRHVIEQNAEQDWDDTNYARATGE